MSYGPIKIDGERRRLLCPPIYRKVDGGGRVYVGLAYAGKEIVAHVTYPQGDDKGRYVQIGRPSLPRFDPLMGDKIEIADMARRLAADAIADDSLDENNKNTGLALWFVSTGKDAPTKDEARLVFRILDEMLEAEIFEAEIIPNFEEEEDCFVEEERIEAYTRQCVEYLLNLNGRVFSEDEDIIMSLVYFAREKISLAIQRHGDDGGITGLGELFG